MVEVCFCVRGVISPILSNMTLDGLEAKLAEKFPKVKLMGLKMNMVRYADDFIITGHSKEWLEKEAKPVVVEFLAERGLVLSPEKTRITHIEEGFDFLGWNLRKYDGTLLMKPSKANVKAHLDRIREVIKANKTATQANLIRLLNPILRGWANYHSHVVAKETFARNDDKVWSMLWQWATRGTPRRAPNGLQRNTFKPEASGSGYLQPQKNEKMGRREVILLDECDTPIQRHVKIRSDANPHDPKWEQYFATRWGQKMLKSVKGRTKLYRVWSRQDVTCPVCQEPITLACLGLFGIS